MQVENGKNNLEELFECEGLRRFKKKEPYKKQFRLIEDGISHIENLETVFSNLSKETYYPVSIYKCMKDPKVKQSCSIHYILDQIKTGGDNRDIILEARKAGKGSKRFDKMKASLPTFTPNATFNDYRKRACLNKLSGLIYLDVDGTTHIDFTNPFIYATWRSISNTGRGILVRVQGLTDKNIKGAYQSIANQLGIQGSVDSNCAEISRQNVISYDEDLYLNERSLVYEYKEDQKDTKTHNKVTLKKEESKVTPLLGINKKKTIFKWNNLDSYDLEGEKYVYFKTKKFFVKAYMPKKIEIGSRNAVISTFLTNFVFLNPNLTENDFERILMALNDRCTKPLKSNELLGILNKKLKLLKKGELIPYENFPRSLVFSKDVPREEKYKVCGYYSGLTRSEKSKMLIVECLEDWDLNYGKVTNQKIARSTGLSVNTVSNHMRNFKPQKDFINRVIKEDKNSKK